jgi:preprotein translocase subunit SecF
MDILSLYIQTKKALIGVTILAMSVMFSLATAEQSQSDEYQQRVLLQIQKLQLTEEQLEPFRKNLQAFYKARNGVTRRISRQGGDLEVRIGRELRKTRDKAVKKMATVLRAEQLEQYREIVKIASDQYLNKAGLL